MFLLCADDLTNPEVILHRFSSLSSVGTAVGLFQSKEDRILALSIHKYPKPSTMAIEEQESVAILLKDLLEALDKRVTQAQL